MSLSFVPETDSILSCLEEVCCCCCCCSSFSVLAIVAVLRGGWAWGYSTWSLCLSCSRVNPILCVCNMAADLLVSVFFRNWIILPCPCPHSFTFSNCIHLRVAPVSRTPRHMRAYDNERTCLVRYRGCKSYHIVRSRGEATMFTFGSEDFVSFALSHRI